MRVAVISKSDAAGGGAGRMAQQLSAWLRDADHEAVHFARWGATPFGGTFQPAYGRAVHFAKRVEGKLLMNESLPLETASVLWRLRSYAPDVVHFHDITTAFNVKTIGAVAARYPTVWTLHDQSPMTGGCITAFPCDRYLKDCGSCPRFPSWSMHGKVDRTAAVIAQKRAFFADRRAELTAPSRSAVDRLVASGILQGRPDVHVVHNGMDMRTFQPLDRATVRRWLGLPTDRFIVLLIAHDLDDALKNPESQREALRAVADHDPFLLIVGNTVGNPGITYAPNEVKNLGYVASEPLKNALFSAADVFLNTSLGDTFSLTTLEALAAGTPVVAYASGGIPEVVTDGESGFLVEPDDAVALAAVLRDLIRSRRTTGMREAARCRAMAFSHEHVVEDFVAVYERAREGFAA